jgi:alkylation response protein AidB-like acyl-CoA dehydrogenase
LNFNLTDEQQMLRDMVRSLLEKEASDSYLRDHDENHRYPYGLYKKFVDVGLLGLPFLAAYGGQERSLLDFVIVSEELGRKGYDVAAVYGTPIFCGLTVQANGNEEQRANILPALIRGKLRLAVSISETDSGSDAGSMRTMATRQGDFYVLNGEKTWCSGADVDDTTILMYCRTSANEDHNKAISAFLVDNRTPGLEIRRIPTMGRHLLPTTQIFLHNVEIPLACRLGAEGEGWRILLSGLLRERLLTSAAYIGNAAAVVDQALQYSKDRVQFGKRIGDFQVIAHMLADMYTDVGAARLLTYWAGTILESGQDSVLAVSMAKLFGSEKFLEIANNGMQIMGGMGYSMEGSMQRHLRAARGATITAGTSQMQREIIARKLGLRP